MININGVESVDTHDLGNDTLITLEYLNDERRMNEDNEKLGDFKAILAQYNYQSDVDKLGELLRAF
jgi:hypothetical protein